MTYDMNWRPELKPCPFCGGKMRAYPGRPRGGWTITFVCQGECRFKISYSEARYCSRGEFDKQRYELFNKRVD